jgi:hypothetical protein
MYVILHVVISSLQLVMTLWKDWMYLSFKSIGYLDHLLEDLVALQPELVTFLSAGLDGCLVNLQPFFIRRATRRCPYRDCPEMDGGECSFTTVGKWKEREG